MLTFWARRHLLRQKIPTFMLLFCGVVIWLCLDDCAKPTGDKLDEYWRLTQHIICIIPPCTSVAGVIHICVEINFTQTVIHW